MIKLFEKITGSLVQNGNIQKEDETVYQYALKSVLILGGNVLLSLLIGVYMGVPGYCILFLAALIPLRSDAGGYHASNLIICYLLSFVSLALSMFIVRAGIAWHSFVIAAISFGSALCIFRFAPLESKGKPIENDERIYIRKRARKIVCLEWGVGALLLLADRRAAYAVWLAIICCAIGYAGWFIKRKTETVAGHEETETK